MAATRIYTNEYAEEISPEQANKLHTYYVRIFENNVETKHEAYSNGLLISTSYKITSHNDVNGILLTNPNASFSLAHNEGDFRIYEEISYRDGLLESKTKMAEKNKNIICYHVYDVVTDMPIHLKTEKSYFDHDGLEIYSFYYNEDGTCFEIIKPQEYQTDFLASQIGHKPDIDFTWEGFEYYQNSLPLIPNITT